MVIADNIFQVPGEQMETTLPPVLDAESVDTLAATVAEEKPSSVVLRVERVPEVRLGGDARLLSWLATLRTTDISTRVVLGISRDELLGMSTGKYNRFLKHTAAGFIMSELASEVVDSSGHDIRPELQSSLIAALTEGAGVVGHGKQKSAVKADRLGRPPAAIGAWNASIEEFRRFFVGHMLKGIGLGALPLKVRDPLADFVFEAVSNTHDHARRALGPAAHHGIRVLTARRINLADETLDELSDKHAGIIDTYLDLLKHEWTGSPEFLLEVTVADTGVGIPATLHGSQDIYKADFKVELDILFESVKPGVSSKPAGVVGAGQGLFNMLEAVDILNGLIVIRTGRCHVYRHCLGDAPRWPDTTLFATQQQPLPLLRGTSVSVFLPAGLLRVASAAVQYGLPFAR